MSFLPRGMLGMCGAHGEPVIGSLLPRNSPPPNVGNITKEGRTDCGVQNRMQRAEEARPPCAG